VARKWHLRYASFHWRFNSETNIYALQGEPNMKTEYVPGLMAIAGLTLFHPNAYAYLDPGTGSMILQALIAGVAVVGVTIKLYWFKLVAFLKGEKYSDEDEDLLAGLDLDTHSDNADQRDL